ncbi:MAG: tetratricopeptide repeat protein [Pseudomonadales bacterium]
MQDRYGNPLSTSSVRAHGLYCEGMDLFLAAQPGGIESLIAATQEDPGFAIAHADLARAQQIMARPKQARAALAAAREAAAGLGTQEASHVEVMSALIGGQSALAYAMIAEHVQAYPRDAMVLSPALGVFGLIGFSGQHGREAENLAFMQAQAPHYVGDWWFESQMAFALCEVGQLDRAASLIDAAFAANPRNANAVHHRAHVHYELGETEAGCKLLQAWRHSYDRSGLLHCHLAWHDALWNLGLGQFDRVWEILRADIAPEQTTAPPINVATDLIALLLRAELAGAHCDPELWQTAADYVLAHFSRPGISFVDLHTAIAVATTGAQEPLEKLYAVQSGTAADLVGRVARAFAAWRDQDWSSVLDYLTPVMAEHERLGGSRAQRDLLELTYSCALAQLDPKMAQRFLASRRPNINFSASLGAGPIDPIDPLPAP